MEVWKFISTIEVDKEFLVNGLNIWNHYWHCTNRHVKVVDPFERQHYDFKEYIIVTPNKKAEFVAGEFTNGKIGIYCKEPTVKI